MLMKRGYAVSENDMNMTLDTFLRDVFEFQFGEVQYCDAEGNPNLNEVTIPVGL